MEGGIEKSTLKSNKDQVDSKDDPDAKGFFDFSDKKRSVGRMPIERDSDVYNMKHKERGKAIIFNHRDFEQKSLGKRSGTDEDRDRLQRTLKSLGFEVSVYDNATRKKVFEVIDSLAAEDHSDRDCVLVAVFSHGELNLVHASDDFYKPDRLWNPFSGHLCPTLAGKPKIFLLQACQGDQLDGGITLHGQRSRTAVDSGSFGRQDEYTVPNKADFLMVYSTFPGYYAWRNITQGSWFIQSFCDVINTNSSKRDLMSMLTIVARNVALNFESNVPGSHMHEKKQIPLTTSTLTRDIIFF